MVLALPDAGAIGPAANHPVLDPLQLRVINATACMVVKDRADAAHIRK
jgi:hypothetical protein